MKRPLFRRLNTGTLEREQERGVTMVLVALAMVAIIAMAALSIDVVTLYLAREEAQRSADNAALAAARIISLSGLTGDPTNSSGYWQTICAPDNGVNGVAARAAKAVAGQDTVGGLAATTINVTYSAGTGGSMGAGTNDCTTLSTTAFGVNPLVTVQITRASLPSFFSRIWGNTGNTISATATAEGFNPSNSGANGNETSGTIIPVQPRCVKPWVVPNLDPGNTPGCTTGCAKFVGNPDGSIQRPGISLNGGPNPGVIGETFWLDPDCRRAISGYCMLHGGGIQPQANYSGSPGYAQPPPNLLYVPGQVGTPVLAVPSSCSGDQYQDAIVGCDQPTNYSCGQPPASAPTPNAVDLTINPVLPTTNGGQCLINQGSPNDVTSASGQDTLNPFAAPSAYPFQILAGSNNPNGLSGTQITYSASVVSLPIYDNTTNVTSNTRTEVTFVGFLQVFINAIDQNGNINVTVLNVAGCSNGSGTPVGSSPVYGNSPVPVRLVTPP